MKYTIIRCLAVATVVLGVIACGEKKQDHHADHESDEDADWTMMDEFHMVMADAFHPYKDSANLQPAKDHASHMVVVADKWADSELPERVNNEKVKSLISKLRDNAREFEKIVGTENDQEIAAALNQLHDDFHEIQDAWYHAEGDHSHHEH